MHRALVRIIMALALLVQVGTCNESYATIPPGTPGDTVCSAELSQADCSNFQRLFDRKDIGLRILEGCAFATVDSLRKKNYVVVLKCVNPQNFIVIVKLSVIRNRHIKVMEVEPTSERHLPA